jgi:hypothetical protein
VRNRKRIIGLILLLTLILSYRITAGPAALTSKCEPLSDARRSEIAAYLIKRWKIEWAGVCWQYVLPATDA